MVFCYPRGVYKMDVDAILAAKRSKYKSTDVHKEVDLQYDLGNLLASDLNALDTSRLRFEGFLAAKTASA